MQPGVKNVVSASVSTGPSRCGLVAVSSVSETVSETFVFGEGLALHPVHRAVATSVSIPAQIRLDWLRRRRLDLLPDAAVRIKGLPTPRMVLVPSIASSTAAIGMLAPTCGHRTKGRRGG